MDGRQSGDGNERNVTLVRSVRSMRVGMARASFPNIGAGQRLRRDAKDAAPYSHVMVCGQGTHSQRRAGQTNSRLELQRRAICAASYSVQRLASTPPVEKPTCKICPRAG